MYHPFYLNCMSKSKTGALVKDQGSLLAESEGKVAGKTAKGIIKLSEYAVSRYSVIMDTKNGRVLTSDGERVVLVYYVGNGQIDLEGLRDAAWQAVDYLKNHSDHKVRKANEHVMLEAKRIYNLLSQSEITIVNKIHSYEGDLLMDFTVAGEPVDWQVLERVMFFSVMYLITKMQEGNVIPLIFIIRNWWISYGFTSHRSSVDDFACMAATWLKVSAGFVLEVLHLFDAVV